MPIEINTTNIADIKIGSTGLKRVYVGSTLVWEKVTALPMILRFVIPSDNYTLTIPFYNTTGYNGVIDWKDGSTSTITAYNDVDRAHVYALAGTYDVEFSGTFKGIYFNNTGNKLQLTQIVQWGNVGMTSLDRAFYGCTNLSGSLPEFPETITTIGTNAFYNCINLTGTLTIPSSVTSIGASAFLDCIALTTLTIPSSVTSIGDNAFNGCLGFTGALTIPSSMTSIGVGVFRDCSGFNSTITIPSSVTSIGLGAFFGCNNALLSFWMESSTPPTLGGTNVFDSTASTMRIKVPTDAVTTYKTATYWSEYSAKIISQ